MKSEQEKSLRVELVSMRLDDFLSDESEKFGQQAG